MTDMKYRYGEIRKLNEDVSETRTVQFVISDESKDRHNTVLGIDGWDLENFNRNGIVGYQHEVYGGDMFKGADPDQVIGKGRAFVEGNQLIGEVIFEPKEINPLAEKIFQKVQFGTLKSTSVGFAPIEKGDYGKEDDKEEKGAKNETYYYGRRELIEFSIVNIPSNTNALKRDMGEQIANAILYINKQMNEDYSFADLESMTVKDLISLLYGKGIDRDKREIEETDQIEQRNETDRLQKVAIQNQGLKWDGEMININLTQ